MHILDEGFKPAEDDAAWLGTGAYFWERAPELAYEWAAVIYGDDTCVVQAEVDLDDCLDLTAGRDTRILQPYYQRFETLVGSDTVRSLVQDDCRHELDCRVVNLCVADLEEAGRRVRVVRAPFLEGEPLYALAGGPRSALTERGQIQLAVRDASALSNCCILEYEP